MAEHILLVCEGVKTEKQITENLRKYFLKENSDSVIYALYGSHIYSLYNKLHKDPDLELFKLLQEDPKNQELLKDVSFDEVSQIFMFFDYDGHVPSATDDKLSDMLSLFNEETENGKLYISYPMVESIKHINTKIDFQTTFALTRDNKEYKNTAHNEGDTKYRNLTALSLKQWEHLIHENGKKLNFIVNDSFDLPGSYISQSDVFKSQKEKYIVPENKVSVLSVFPIFIIDYYGWKQLDSIF